MEKIRKLERSCLLACLIYLFNIDLLFIYLTPESDYFKYYSNKILYNSSLIPRIDLFIIRIIREHYRLIKTIDHRTIQSSLQLRIQDIHNICAKGYIHASAFLYLNKIGVLQTPDNIPELYHISWNERDKKIYHPLLGNINEHKIKYKYSRIILHTDLADNSRFSNGYYWWLQKNIEDNVRRSRRK